MLQNTAVGFEAALQFHLVAALGTIERVTHLLDDLFGAPHPAAGFTQTDHLEIEPGIWLAKIGIDILPGKNQGKVSIRIHRHPAGTLPVKDSTGGAIFDPIIKVRLGDAGIGWRKRKSDLF